MIDDTTLPSDVMPFSSRREGDQAIGVSVLRSGQPRPYADTERVYRVQFQSWRWRDGNFSWVRDDAPYGHLLAHQMERALAIVGADQLPYGRQEDAPFDSYVDYYHTVAPGVIEVRVVSPSTD